MWISGSVDNSVSKAKQAGVDVVMLDPRTPFTAARARNEGFKRALQLKSSLVYILFIDGDCEVVPGWLEEASNFLDARPDVGVVYGRRAGRHPTQSIYNLLCDIEWDTPIGEAKGCGGDALIRLEALEKVGGYRPDVIAAEDTELCARIRGAGWKIWRLDVEMTVHDAAINRFGQWWRRAVRAGYAFAYVSRLHGASPERLFVWESRRAWLWGILLPLAYLVATFCFSPWGWLIGLIYPLQMIRLSLRNAGPFRQRLWLGMFQVLARFPEGLGQAMFLRDRLFGREAAIINTSDSDAHMLFG